MSNRTDAAGDDANRDPITGSPGAHPVGTGVGAALGGAAAGAAVGTVAGPIGTLVGAAVGAVMGGIAGKDFAEVVDPTRDDDQGRDNPPERPDAGPGSSCADFGAADGFGADSARRYPGRSFEEAEPDLAKAWADGADADTPGWDSARPVARDAWDRARGNCRVPILSLGRPSASDDRSG
jgi:hypothetical protein